MLPHHAIQDALTQRPTSDSEQQYQYYFEQSTYRHFVHLSSDDGYAREEALRYFLYHEEEILFPELIQRLSDYIPVNRALATQHLNHWLTRPSCADLCLKHFLLIMIVSQRDRTNLDILEQLLATLCKKIDVIEDIITQQQGKLARQLFSYIQQRQWLDSSKLLTLSATAQDQYIHKYYINNLLKQPPQILVEALKTNKHPNVQYAVLKHLTDSQQYTVDILLITWQSRSLSVLDLTTFYLKKNHFNFEDYFKNSSPNTEQSIRQQLKQMLVSQWQQPQDFLDLLNQLPTKNSILAWLKKAYKQQYIGLPLILEFLSKQNHTYSFDLLRKFKTLSENKLTLSEADQLLIFAKNITFTERLFFLREYSFWDQLHWVITQWAWCISPEDEAIYIPYLTQLWQEIPYQYYAPSWSTLEKEKIYTQCVILWAHYSFETPATLLLQLQKLLIKVP